MREAKHPSRQLQRMAVAQMSTAEYDPPAPAAAAAVVTNGLADSLPTAPTAVGPFRRPWGVAVVAVASLAVLGCLFALAGPSSEEPATGQPESITVAQAGQLALLSASWDSLDVTGRQVLCEQYTGSPQRSWERYDQHAPGQVSQAAFDAVLTAQCG